MGCESGSAPGGVVRQLVHSVHFHRELFGTLLWLNNCPVFPLCSSLRSNGPSSQSKEPGGGAS